MHRMTDCYSHRAFDSSTPGLHQEGSVKERCGFKEATLTWHNCSAPAWLEHLGGQKTNMENQYFKDTQLQKMIPSTTADYSIMNLIQKPIAPKTSFHCFNSSQPVWRLNDIPFRWQFHLSLFLPGCGMRGSLLWWCATTMLTFAGWATRRIPRRWCQKWQQLFAVAKRCAAQGVLFLSRRLMIHGYMLGFVSQNDSLVPLLKTSMMTALRVFYKHLMHFFCLRWECLYLAPGGKSPRSFQVLAEYAAAHDQVSLGLVWMKVFDETKMITWRMFRYIGISMQMANRQAYQRSIKIRLTHVVSNHSRPRPTWHLALRIHMAPLSSMQAKCCGLVLAAVGLCGQKWSRGDES